MRLIKINCIALFIEGLGVLAYFFYMDNTLPQNAIITFLGWQFSRETGLLLLERIGEFSVLAGVVGCLGVRFLEWLRAPKNVVIPQAASLSPQIPVVAGYGEASEDADVQGRQNDVPGAPPPFVAPVTEREMEELLWTQAERLLGEPLRPLRRQASGELGRAELVFVDRSESLLIVQVRRGKLQRGDIHPLGDSFEKLKREFPDRAVELMAVANEIPPERRLACDRRNIEAREISEAEFRRAASETGYVLASEEEGGGPAAVEAAAVEEEIAQPAAPLHAEVIEEPATEHAHEEFAAAAEEATGPYRTRRGRKKHSTAGTLGLVLGLLAVAVVAILFRQQLAEGFDRLLEVIWGKPAERAKESATAPGTETPKSEPTAKS